MSLYIYDYNINTYMFVIVLGDCVYMVYVTEMGISIFIGYYSFYCTYNLIVNHLLPMACVTLAFDFLLMIKFQFLIFIVSLTNVLDGIYFLSFYSH